MGPYEKQLRIILDVPKQTAAYYKLQQKWENEGGAIAVDRSTDILEEANLPFRAGEAFQVIDGEIEIKDEEVIYIVNVQKVDIE
ncbi:hypothetical protein [Rhodohalobacter barkolensis]|jgi:hypothetical protein|uniref:Uncharacterized protein n=1 Tax=Rhodohalobacter barkolensis TaxID=2053187 RepID=A0A2N0VIP2_9BACT|nr:hypothetical protein [Rhodohalobacter barkolensis]PKD44056.1 hypothetical protein CWD77_00835 [Rhodohalobacter barkolensis]